MRAAKANVLPGLVIQLTMLALALVYFHHPVAAVAFDHLADSKQRSGFRYALVAGMVAGAIIPELLRVFFFQSGRVHRENFANLIFTLPFWGTMCVIVDLFYQLQAWMFGSGMDFQTVAIKVLVDQLGYTAFFATPVTCILYDWRHGGYQARTLLRVFRLGYYRDAVLPTLIANWAVWVPLISIIYSLPPTLQIPFFSLALSLWVMLYTWMSERRNRTGSQ